MKKLLNSRYFTKLSSIKDFLITLAFPNHCLICDKITDEESLFCLEHYKKVKFISFPKCEICSKPLTSKAVNKVKCIKCIHKSPSYDSSTIIFVYEKTISKAILALKYNDSTYICKRLGKIFAKRIAKDQENFDIIAPVPLHKKRIKTRKYNQSIILGKQIAINLKNTEFIPDLLIRTKFTKTQENLNISQRQENIKNAFILNPKYQDLIKGKKVILVDDVISSGSTVENCSKILKKSKTTQIKIAAIAKTV